MSYLKLARAATCHHLPVRTRILPTLDVVEGQRSLKRHGYCVIGDALPKSAIRELLDWSKHFYIDSLPYCFIRECPHPTLWQSRHRWLPVVERHLDRRIINPAQFIQPHVTHFLVRRTSDIPNYSRWHLDSGFYSRFCSVIIPLEPFTLYNGPTECLSLVHEQPQTDSKGQMHDTEPKLQRSELFVATPGSLLILDSPNVWHRAVPALNPTLTRWSFVLRFCSVDVDRSKLI